jgi:hypothetical protein
MAVRVRAVIGVALRSACAAEKQPQAEAQRHPVEHREMRG